MALELRSWSWLCVVPDLPPDEEIRAFWNVKENQVEASATDADQFWLGVSDPTEDRPFTSAALRVAALLFLHGTTPEYTLPMLTDAMIDAICEAFAPTSVDRFPAAAEPRLRRFLLAHRGGFAFTRKGGGPNTGEHDEELNRLMREHAASQPHGSHTVRVTARRLGEDEPDDGGAGVREPRRPTPSPLPSSAAVEPDDE